MPFCCGSLLLRIAVVPRSLAPETKNAPGFSPGRRIVWTVVRRRRQLPGFCHKRSPCHKSTPTASCVQCAACRRPSSSTSRHLRQCVR